MSKAIVIRDDGASFESVEKFRGMEAEYLGFAKVSNVLIAMRAGKSMRSVENEAQVVFFRNAGQRFNVTRANPYVYREDAGGPFCDERFDACRINRVPLGCDVGEHRRDPQPTEGVGGGHERKRRDDHLAHQADGLGHDFKGDRAVAAGDTMPNTQKIGNPLLQFVNKLGLIRKSSAIEDVPNPGLECLQTADIGSTIIQGLGKY